ncbi:MAG TPA: glycosyltransferase [Candidatus Saccharimonadales bacterium]|nr:glycosyltransferase [Candidatus Saccharimonadales bacterium]
MKKKAILLFNFLKHISEKQKLVHFDTKKGKGFFHKNDEYIHHSLLQEHEHAFFILNREQLNTFLLFILFLEIALFFSLHRTITLLLGTIIIMYFSDLLFNLFLVIRSFSSAPEIEITQKEIYDYPSAWPRYTILCPLYKEAAVLDQFITAMKNIDYPKHKLQVLLLLEEDDTESFEVIKKMRLPQYFEIIVVPHSFPKTKPKAMNYGLRHVSGEFVVIYDGEDIPDPQQLKKVVVSFKKLDNNVVCIQAKLNFYNAHQNLLTRVFTAEYSLWFDLILPGLQSIHAPIPLGGTSNHFKKKDLIAMRAWDSFNVTEDADLGMRLAQNGGKTAMLNSTTYEEANSSLRNWFHQRTRWIKGYIQTYLVHTRDPKEHVATTGRKTFLIFNLIIGGKVVSALINPLMWMLTILYFLYRAHIGILIESFFPPYILYMGVVSFFFGNFLYLFYYMLGASQRGQDELIKYVFLVPFYWILLSAAAWRAIYTLITEPHYWPKTIHGLHLAKKL